MKTQSACYNPSQPACPDLNEDSEPLVEPNLQSVTKKSHIIIIPRDRRPNHLNFNSNLFGMIFKRVLFRQSSQSPISTCMVGSQMHLPLLLKNSQPSHFKTLVVVVQH